jgi:light-regulated signal transduction histidine kinase (bacteriophytochrome)
MNDRRRLLVLSVLVTVAVSISCVLVTYYHVYRYERHGDHAGDPLWLAAGTIALIFFGGGALLLRVNHSFVRRLEVSEARTRAVLETVVRINRELDDFTCVASHDLKEPLRGIAGYCQLLHDGYQERLDENGRRMLMALVGLCERLSQLVDDLLAYARVGHAEPQRSPMDLTEVAENVIERLAPAIEMRHGTVRIVGSLPTLSVDAVLVAEALQNLIANGLKFNESATPTVEIGCHGGHPVTFFVRDNGIGIPEQHHAAVFEMFRRLHSRRKFGGTGAGLAIVRKIIEAHGGQVWIESKPGAGTTVLFTLEPAVKMPAPHLRKLLTPTAG